MIHSFFFRVLRIFRWLALAGNTDRQVTPVAGTKSPRGNVAGRLISHDPHHFAISFRVALYFTFSRRHGARGFTHIELLAVIAIIAILIALPCPPCRRSARPRRARKVPTSQIGTRCTLSRRLQDLSCPAPRPYGPREAANAAAHGWGTFLLPYIEQGNIQYD